MEQLTDDDLVDRVRQGSQEAYRILVDRHKAYVFTLIYRKVGQRETAEDLAQEVFIKLYRSLDRFRGESAFATWLYRLTVNAVTDYLRTKRRRPLEAVIDQVKGWFAADRRQEPEQRFLAEEERDTMAKLLLKLPAKYRDVIDLYHYKQMTYQEIALLLQLPVKTVETRLYRGKAMLKELWLEVYGHETGPSERRRHSAVSKRYSGRT